MVIFYDIEKTLFSGSKGDDVMAIMVVGVRLGLL